MPENPIAIARASEKTIRVRGELRELSDTNTRNGRMLAGGLKELRFFLKDLYIRAPQMSAEDALAKVNEIVEHLDTLKADLASYSTVLTDEIAKAAELAASEDDDGLGPVE